MLSQCWCCYNVKTVDGEWCDIGLPGMVREMEGKEHRKLEISHGICPMCFRAVMENVANKHTAPLVTANGNGIHK